ncbi:hypothetical protein LTR74_004378 [Friedmanniomyces endolithicus]|nr:hypothetical protein LTR74_004378 [Friedmanniomyces endolithicus]
MWHLPNVDPAWYTAQADKELVLQAFKRSRAVWQVLVDLGVADPVKALPGPSVQTHEQIMQYIGEAMITGTRLKISTASGAAIVLESGTPAE